MIHPRYNQYRFSANSIDQEILEVSGLAEATSNGIDLEADQLHDSMLSEFIDICDDLTDDTVREIILNDKHQLISRHQMERQAASAACSSLDNSKLHSWLQNYGLPIEVRTGTLCKIRSFYESAIFLKWLEGFRKDIWDYVLEASAGNQQSIADIQAVVTPLMQEMTKANFILQFGHTILSDNHYPWVSQLRKSWHKKYIQGKGTKLDKTDEAFLAACKKEWEAWVYLIPLIPTPFYYRHYSFGGALLPANLKALKIARASYEKSNDWVLEAAKYIARECINTILTDINSRMICAETKDGLLEVQQQLVVNCPWQAMAIAMSKRFTGAYKRDTCVTCKTTIIKKRSDKIYCDKKLCKEQGRNRNGRIRKTYKKREKSAT